MLHYTYRSKLMPDFYYGGLLQLHNPEQVYSLIITSLAPGLPLSQVLGAGEKQLNTHIYSNLRRAVVALWKLGIVHGDLHNNNIFYEAASHQMALIDLGFAVKLLKHIIDGVKQLDARSKPRVGIQTYNKLIYDYVEHCMIKRHTLEDFRHDTVILDRWARQLSAQIAVSLQKSQRYGYVNEA